MSSRVPNELWREVFSYLPQDTLLDVSLTDRLFSSISRSYIFAKFDFHPYVFSYASITMCANDVLLPPPSEIKRSLQRLKFWTSPEIAPLVRACAITPFRRHAKGLKFSTTDQPFVLLTALFESLMHFTGVQTISAAQVHLTQTGLVNVCRMPDLRSLSVTDYILAPGQVLDFSSLESHHLFRLQLHND
jgi:hypothetical protein